MKFLLFVFALLLQGICFSQDTLIKVYFEFNKHELIQNELTKLKGLDYSKIQKISIDSYTDTIGNLKYNIDLSNKRSLFVKNYFDSIESVISSNGEHYNLNIPLHLMRETSIKIWFKKLEIVHTNLNEDDEDTTLVFESGTIIKLNKKFFLSVKDCFKFNEFQNAMSLLNNNLTTVSNTGASMISGGMFDLFWCKDTCLIKPIYLLIPVPTCVKGNQMYLYTLDTSLLWNDTKIKINEKFINGEMFYEVFIKCQGKYNIDFLYPSYYNNKIKIKMSDGFKIQGICVAFDCPLFSYHPQLKKGNTLAILGVICPRSEPLIFVRAINNKGEILIIEHLPLNQLIPKNRLKKMCPCKNNEKERFLGVFKIKKQFLYAKYKIKRKHGTVYPPGSNI